MEILGHSQIALTANLYSHVAPEVQPEAADRMDALLRRLAPPAPDAAPQDQQQDTSA